MENFRMVRVNELLKRAIGEYLHRNFKTEAVAITITRVEASPNLRSANVYFSVYDPHQRQHAFQLLKRIRSSIQCEIGKSVRLKYTPHLTFVWDESLEKTHRTLTLIDKLDVNE